MTERFETGCDLERLKHVGMTFASCPEDFNIHRQLKRGNLGRQKSIEDGENIDWATAEALAFGTLLMEKTTVRLSGQDVERGTFSQRHHVLHDQEEHDKIYNPLQHLAEDQAPYYLSNSHLSEYAVLGFELGYAQTSPHALGEMGGDWEGGGLGGRGRRRRKRKGRNRWKGTCDLD